MNLATIIEPHPDDRVALITHGRKVTYGQLRAQVAGLRGALAAEGIAKGDRVAIVCTNGSHFVTAYFAVLGLGAIAVPVNPESPAAELAAQLRHVEAKAVLIGPAAGAGWTGVDRSSIPSIHLVIQAGGSDGDGREWDALYGHEPVPVVDVEPDDLAALLFTSGTAGRPLAAMLSHGNLRANIDQSLANPDRMRSDDVVFGVLPLFHIFGLNVVLGITLAVGGCVVLVPRFDPSTALDLIAEHGVTIVPGAPPMWLAWAAMEGIPPGAFATVRQCFTGASKMPEAPARLLAERSGIVLREGYGLTEASPVVTSSAGIEPRIGSVGVPIKDVEVRLVDAEGGDVLAGDAGEIWVRGPNVFKGYWNDPATTARVLRPDGWLRTGDIGVADDDGYLYLVDRAKDLIIVSGFNVYPAEVEEVIDAMPGVVEAAVVGVPHPHTGEAVKAFVVLEPGASLTEEQVIAWVGERLARYKCPGSVVFVDELPRGASGKILRRVLR